MSKIKQKRAYLTTDGEHLVTKPDVAIPMGTVDIPERVLGFKAKSEIKSVLDDVMSKLYTLKVAKDANKPIDISQAVDTLSDKLSILEGLINTLS